MKSKFHGRRLLHKGRQSSQSLFLAALIAMTNVGLEPSQAIAAQNISATGQGFTVTAADLRFILKQIKIAEAHVVAPNPDPIADPDNCQALLGSGPNQIASPLLSDGLRTVSGACNNLQTDQTKFGASDQPFPRLTSPIFKQAETAVVPGIGPVGPPGLTSYTQTSGSVVDSQPRLVSNLIVDQTSTNPAAIDVAEHPVRTQGAEGVISCLTDPLNPNCIPIHETLFIPNVTTDVGLSPPFNSLFTIFGQFFDHGLDKIANGGNGAVFVPLRPDDPLIAGPDHEFGTDCDTASPSPECADNLPADKRFMVLTRGKIIPGADGFRNAANTDTPFVDQSQTYASHPTHQAFLREYQLSSGRPLATGRFLSTPDGGLADWGMIKQQARDILGLQLVDSDVNNIPMLATDLYGNFIPGPDRGMPQFVRAGGAGLVEGDPSANGGNGVLLPADALHINVAFLNDIAHSAAPTVHVDCSTLPPGSSAPCLLSGDPLIGTLFPDSDSLAGTSLATPNPPGSYDDELLEEHYICGDGRCNENIALTAVHQIFHMEHDRLVDYFYHDDGSNVPGSITGVLAENPDLLAEYQAVNLIENSPSKTFTFHERLFQAARFVTEMQYQHLVFEEFARKVQPAINPFQPFAFNQTDLNPAITAEFAHAVYRFGHSMLNESIPRLNEDGSTNDIPLLDGFLNPLEFNNGGSAGHLNDREATAAIIMGLSDQVGNEIDEFVSETLRNNLLGLPLDLPSLNMTRARSEGIPSLNNVRREIHALTNDAQMAPYANWIDFEQSIKHPVSLVNFIAAYGKHPTIRDAGVDNALGTDCGTPLATAECADNNTTLAGKRAAANLIVNGGTGAPADRNEFLFSTGAWENVGGVSKTGVDDIDLWMGGLAENTNVFGGLLGSTFNYVFEKQLTDLQNGDRFYYLARTPGMNLRTQLEGNSFAELVMRNTVRANGTSLSHTLKADPFATADCKFELANLNATPAGFTLFGANVADDLSTECREDLLLIRLPDGTIKYRSTNTVDPPGINGQAVYNGTDFADFFYGGNDNDTFWGGLGNDTVNGGGGDDVVLGGDGDDIITDFAGADVLKGGPGNDAIDGGPGDDLLMPGLGNDFTNGGANINETFASEGDDFAIAGQGEDAVFGDGGDDWEEGGDQPDLLIGDNSSLFFDDRNVPGHDILIGQGGDDDYDMEGGDDIGVAGPGVEKNAGASGWDWLIGLNDPQPQVMDLNLNLIGVPLPANAVRDRFNEVEALSGWKFNDTLSGDSVVPSLAGGGGFTGCDALDADGVARIAGLELLVTPAMRVFDPGPQAAASATNYCGLEAEPGFAGEGTQGGVWGEGNILLGGAGSDTLEGRGANDIIDGDKYLNVRLSVRTNPADPSTQTGTTFLMENTATTGNFGPGTAGMTLQQAVFARKVNPGNIVAVREILRPAIVPPDCTGPIVPPNTSRVNCDKALYSGPRINANGIAEYSVTPNADGSVTVTDLTDATAVAVPVVPLTPRTPDGIDILWNVEQLSFCTTPGAVRGTCTTRSAPVNIIPATSFTGNLGFGNVVVNSSLTRTIVVRNSGVAKLVISNVTPVGTDATMFTVQTNTCTGAELMSNTTPAQTCSITVRFSPDARRQFGDASTFLQIEHNGAMFKTNVPMSGGGTVPIATVSPETFNFGGVQTGLTVALAPTQVITLSNNTGGDAPLTVQSISLTGSSDFTKTGTCTTVAVGSNCAVTIRFRPTVGGSKTAVLTFTDNSNGVAGSVQTVTLEGNGTITANNDAFPLPGGTPFLSTATGAANVQFSPAINVRANDLPANAGTVSIVSSVTFTPAPGVPAGASATAQAVTSTGATTGTLTHVRFFLTPSQTAGLTNLDRQASKRGTYSVTYQLTNGTVTTTAVVTLTVS